MPIYNYLCPRCGLSEDRLVKYKDRDAQSHNCDDVIFICLERQLSAPAGWVAGRGPYDRYL